MTDFALGSRGSLVLSAHPISRRLRRREGEDPNGPAGCADGDSPGLFEPAWLRESTARSSGRRLRSRDLGEGETGMRGGAER